MAITLSILMLNWTWAWLDEDFSQGVSEMLFLDLGINSFLGFYFYFCHSSFSLMSTVMTGLILHSTVAIIKTYYFLVYLLVYLLMGHLSL